VVLGLAKLELREALRLKANFPEAEERLFLLSLRPATEASGAN
jgi:hypothetical protein